ncbi:hypothetical protein G6514_005562 [Epicoccum nigrum]|nr:hypothetical protein G6514_005562 [Epicoccum nigrum]
MSKPPPHPIKEPSDAYRMRLYDNGLLNLEDTPPHLVAAVQRNANSPLLSLPPEIRNRIWSLACGGRVVAILNQRNGKGEALVKAGAIRGTFDSTITLQQYEFIESVDYHWPQLLPLAFRLPEVCRQIYSEAALTSYKENVFRLYNFRCMSKLLELNEAQRNAITALEASPSFFLAELVESYDDNMYLEFEKDIELFRKLMVKEFTTDTVSGGLPNFRRFVVANLTIRHTRRCYEGGWEWEEEDEEVRRGVIESEEQLKAWVLDHFASLTVKGVEIVFEG